MVENSSRHEFNELSASVCDFELFENTASEPPSRRHLPELGSEVPESTEWGGVKLKF